MSERCERTSERRSEWPSTLRVDFISFLPNVRSLCMKSRPRCDSEGFMLWNIVLTSTFVAETKLDEMNKSLSCFCADFTIHRIDRFLAIPCDHVHPNTINSQVPWIAGSPSDVFLHSSRVVARLLCVRIGCFLKRFSINVKMKCKKK